MSVAAEHAAVGAARLWFAQAALARPVPEPLRRAMRVAGDEEAVVPVEQIDARAWARALVPARRERTAAARGVHEGWLSRRDAEKLAGVGALERRVAALPGNGSEQAELVPDVMAALHLDAARARCPRSLPASRLALRADVYLDASGSLPNPTRTLSPAVVAALVLVCSVLRAGGRARLVVFSSAPVPFYEWTRCEDELSRFAMHYVGAGTVLPAAWLRASLAGEVAGEPPTHCAFVVDGLPRGVSAGDPAETLHACARTVPTLALLLDAPVRAARALRAGGTQVARVGAPARWPAAAARAVGPWLVATGVREGRASRVAS